MKLLLIEDDRQNCEVVQTCFEVRGAEITAIADGPAVRALAALRKEGAAELIQLHKNKKNHLNSLLNTT